MYKYNKFYFTAKLHANFVLLTKEAFHQVTEILHCSEGQTHTTHCPADEGSISSSSSFIRRTKRKLITLAKAENKKTTHFREPFIFHFLYSIFLN